MAQPATSVATEATAALLQCVARLVEACPAPAILAGPPDRLLSLNAAAAELFDRSFTGAGEGLRALLGVGWLELETTARDGASDIVLEVRGRGARERSRRWRARLEPLGTGTERPFAVVAFLEPTPEATVPVRRSTRLASGFDALFGSDRELVATKRAAERFATTPVPILLLAETGTGKELLARAIHLASRRGERAFVAINCGALSAQLLESELFGYAPGAFTGASREGNEGKVGAAHGGTLFLDEIAEMPASLQALLLRVLEDGTYYRIGESRPRQADVRLIAATSRDLPAMVAAGSFREDLFYRVNGACLSLPPLRERQDLAELLPQVLDTVAHELGRGESPAISPEAAVLLLASRWPGNFRQFKSALRFALVLCDGDRLLPEHLPRDLGTPGLREEKDEHPGSAAVRPTSTDPVASEARPAQKTLRELERERLARALEAAPDNLSVVARDLGIARTTLYRRLRKHGFLA
ncbi:MAG: sigma 54-interacting transcriptional regulator [Thermoanaerobaculia bacterium]